MASPSPRRGPADELGLDPVDIGTPPSPRGNRDGTRASTEPATRRQRNVTRASHCPPMSAGERDGDRPEGLDGRRGAGRGADEVVRSRSRSGPT